MLYPFQSAFLGACPISCLHLHHLGPGGGHSDTQTGVSMGVLGCHLSSGSGWRLMPGDIGQPGKVRSLVWQVLGALRRDRRFMPSVPARTQQAHHSAPLPQAWRLRALGRCFPGCRFRLCWALVPGPSKGSEPQSMPPGQQVPPVAT